MAKYADHLHIDVVKIYKDVKLSIEKGIPVVEMQRKDLMILCNKSIRKSRRFTYL